MRDFVQVLKSLSPAERSVLFVGLILISYPALYALALELWCIAYGLIY